MLKSVCLLGLVSVAYAAVAIYPQEQKPAELADQAGCYLSNLNKVLPYNIPYYPGNACASYICQNNNETLYETCGSKSPQPGCTLSANDLTKNYPDCCGEEVCPSTSAPSITQAPTQAPVSQYPAPQGSSASASAQAFSGQTPTPSAPTTQAPTTQAPTTQAPTAQAPTSQVPTTQAPTTQAPTTQAPVAQAPVPQGPSAYASAKSVNGQAPVITTYKSGPDAQASATAS